MDLDKKLKKGKYKSKKALKDLIKFDKSLKESAIKNLFKVFLKKKDKNYLDIAKLIKKID